MLVLRFFNAGTWAYLHLLTRLLAACAKNLLAVFGVIFRGSCRRFVDLPRVRLRDDDLFWVHLRLVGHGYNLQLCLA